MVQFDAGGAGDVDEDLGESRDDDVDDGTVSTSSTASKAEGNINTATKAAVAKVAAEQKATLTEKVVPHDDKQAALEKAAADKASQASKQNAAAQKAKVDATVSLQHACATQCFGKSAIMMSNCIEKCMVAGPAKTRIKDLEKHEAGNELGESVQGQPTLSPQLAKIQKHCAYSESAASMMERREELDTVSSLSQSMTDEELRESNLASMLGETRKDTSPSADPSKMKEHMLFVEKFKADGSRNPRGYDNTSMECSCIRDCGTGDNRCVKKCVWEE